MAQHPSPQIIGVMLRNEHAPPLVQAQPHTRVICMPCLLCQDAKLPFPALLCCLWGPNSLWPAGPPSLYNRACAMAGMQGLNKVQSTLACDEAPWLLLTTDCGPGGVQDG